MGVFVARFISLLLTALTAGVVLGHVMSRSGKAKLSRSTFVTVQSTLYRSWGKKVGAVELGAFLSTVAVTLLVRGHGAVSGLCLLGSLCLLAMLIIWAIFIRPINIRVSTWTPESVPEDWAFFRDRWHALHGLRAGFAILGLGALIFAVLLDIYR